METNPEGTAQTYIFLVDNQDIALNIVMSGYQALCLVQEDDGYYFSADSFIEEMRAIQFTGSCQCAYHYVASCTVKWVNDKLLTFFKNAGLDGKAGWQLFKEKEYLGKLDNQKEVEKLLEQYILRFERDPKEEPELSRFHLFDAKGNVKGVRDMEIVDYLVENVQFFVVGITPYYYEHGVFLEEHDGVRMKYRIQKLIYRDQVQSGVIKRIYNLLITQPKVHREAYELNKQPVRWINFKNGYYDPVTGEMLEHNPDYLTINQIPFPYYPEDCEQVLQGGENIKKYLASSLPNKEEQQTLPDLTGAVVMPVAVISLLFVFDWRLGICCLIPLAISVFFLKKMMGGDNADFMSGYMTALENMNKEAVEFVRGIPVVKVFQQTIYSFKNFHAAIEEYKKYASGYAICCRIPLTGFNITLNGTFILLIPTALMLFSAASGQADRQKLFLDFLFYSLFTPVCTTMMNRIMFASEQLMAAKSAVSRIEAILQEKPLKESNTQKQPKDASVVFEDVSFTYPGAKKKALYHVSFEVPDGKKIALVGASGSGKSTAASLIPRFYDVQEGDVLVGGVDVREIAKNDLMDQIAFVFQNTRLFNDTLLENIRASRPDATREEVMRAAEAAQCQDIIERLPNGLDTIVGSGGTYLSGGENQRIALARAILKDAPIIILDEATAFADAENEHQIQLAFEGLTSGKTVLMIAHRLSTIQDADMILVFGDGKIIERGNHDELLKQNGVYASMWKEYQTQIIWKVGTTVRKEENHD